MLSLLLAAILVLPTLSNVVYISDDNTINITGTDRYYHIIRGFGDVVSDINDLKEIGKVFGTVSEQCYDIKNSINEWTSELSFLRHPPTTSIIKCNTDGVIKFKDMGKVLDDYHDKVALTRLHAMHTNGITSPPVDHPIVRNGVLYVNRGYTVVNGDGIIDELLDFIDNHKSSEEEIAYKKDDVIVWDNRRVFYALDNTSDIIRITI